MDSFINRIKKRFSHLKKWARRSQITCFRVYAKDLPDYPVICDWYDGAVVAWIYDRKRDDTPAKKEVYLNAIQTAILTAFNIPEKDLFIKFRGPQKGFQYQKLGHQRVIKTIEEQGLKFEINLSDYLDTGLFLDHRPTRQLCRSLAKGKRVLNCFSYTGSFSMYAIDGGAISTTSVDMSNTYSEWAQRNLALNGFKKRASDRFVIENCLSFLKNDATRNRYDLIICDPPTFSDSKKMTRSFDINRDYIELITDCTKLLAQDGLLIFSTNSKSFKLEPSKLPSQLQIKNITHKSVPEDFKSKRPHQCWLIKS